jgi:hypothetical protein
MAGPLKTLFGALASSQALAGVSLIYGEEEVHTQALPLPMVVMVPMGGPYEESPAYSAAFDETIATQWGLTQAVDFYLWASDPSPTALAIDHVDAIEALRVNVLSALQDQRAHWTPTGETERGLYYKPLAERWAQMDGAYSRFGRGLVLTVQVPTPLAPPAPPVAVIQTQELNVYITRGP